MSSGKRNAAKRLEILAPAGGMEALTAAVRAGADAVYLGSRQFSARSSAQNFGADELSQATAYCRERGVDVHLAVNTLVRDDEIGGALELVKYACSVGVSALIVQDTGLISLIRRACPDMPVHGSTQMSVHTLRGVEHLASMGLTRAVLSRELSFEEIKYITERSPIEIEVFVHGALCMCVSGQCYFSSMLGSRSGNRGSCAQPCRLPFSVSGGTGHDLSLKDLSVIDRLRELEEAGVASAKIEGRMKRPEYVAAATAACRQSLDNGRADDDLTQKLGAVFSRSGFTSGYFDGRLGREMFGVRSREDVAAADSRVFGSLHELYKRERQSVPVRFSLTVKRGENTVLTVTDDRGNKALAKGGVPEEARTVPLDGARCEKSLAKTGGTPYYAEGFEYDIDNGLSLSAASLNALRNEALGELSALRRRGGTVPFTMPETDHGAERKGLPRTIRARFPDGDIPDGFDCCELVYVPLFLSDEKLCSLMDRGLAVAVEIPRGMFGIEDRIERRLKEVHRLGIDDVLAGNIGALESARREGMIIHGGSGLNVFNTQSLLHLEELGLEDAELSFELTLSQIAQLGGKLPRGIITYGRLPLMLTRNCPAQNDGKGCKHCKTAPELTDRKGVHFPMQCSGACTEILNSVPLTLADRRDELTGVDFEVLRFTTESRAERAKALADYLSGRLPAGGHTRGLYYRGVE